MTESLSRLIRTSDPAQPSIPHHKIPASEPPVRIFQHRWMERLTLISFRTFLLFCFIYETLSIVVTFLYSTSLCSSLGYALLGVPIWLITEYLTHRFLFHFASENKTIQHLVYIFHGNHHIQPNHPYRTLMPIIVTLPIGLLIWGGLIWGLGTASGSALFTGFFASYAFYDSIHFATHNFKMKRFPFSIWKRHHLRHHYKTEEHNYSISFPWLDTLFRTKYK